jgi:sulfur-carrier protein adenylyltransferase/sulfurtransferase
MGGLMDPDVPEISVKELKTRLDRGEPLTIIDVRDPHEWPIANLGEYGARLIPMSELAARLDEIDPLEEVVVQCRSGSRSAHIVKYLQSHGYAHVFNLHGGLLAWSDEIDSSMRKY